MASALYTDVKRKGDRSVFTRSVVSPADAQHCKPTAAITWQLFAKRRACLLVLLGQAAGGAVRAERVGGGGVRSRPSAGCARAQSILREAVTQHRPWGGAVCILELASAVGDNRCLIAHLVDCTWAVHRLSQ